MTPGSAQNAEVRPMVIPTCLYCGAISAYPADLLDTDPICPGCGREVWRPFTLRQNSAITFQNWSGAAVVDSQ